MPPRDRGDGREAGGGGEGGGGGLRERRWWPGGRFSSGTRSLNKLKLRKELTVWPLSFLLGLEYDIPARAPRWVCSCKVGAQPRPRGT